MSLHLTARMVMRWPYRLGWWRFPRNNKKKASPPAETPDPRRTLRRRATPNQPTASVTKNPDVRPSAHCLAPPLKRRLSQRFEKNIAGRSAAISSSSVISMKAFGRFFILFALTKTGKPGLGWRVACSCRSLEEDNLFKQFKLDEPWNSTITKN